MTLLRAVSVEVDYAAFCDQDDVWLPDKLSSAVAAYQRRRRPCVCTAVPCAWSASPSPELKLHRRCVRGASFAKRPGREHRHGVHHRAEPRRDQPAGVAHPAEVRDARRLVLPGCLWLWARRRRPSALRPVPPSRVQAVSAWGPHIFWTEWSGRAARQVRQGRGRLLTKPGRGALPG